MYIFCFTNPEHKNNKKQRSTNVLLILNGSMTFLSAQIPEITNFSLMKEAKN